LAVNSERFINISFVFVIKYKSDLNVLSDEN
jgi:hypothetical protein